MPTEEELAAWRASASAFLRELAQTHLQLGSVALAYVITRAETIFAEADDVIDRRRHALERWLLQMPNLRDATVAVIAKGLVERYPWDGRMSNHDRIVEILRTKVLNQTADNVCWRDVYLELAELCDVTFDPQLLPRGEFYRNCAHFYDSLETGCPYDPIVDFDEWLATQAGWKLPCMFDADDLREVWAAAQQQVLHMQPSREALDA